jgi:hypothetical protein
VTWALFADRFSAPSPESAARGFAPRGESAGRLTRAIAERVWLPALVNGREIARATRDRKREAEEQAGIDREFAILANAFLEEP